MVMIVHFEGIIGEVYRKCLSDDVPSLLLRHGTAEGLRELQKSFQLVLFSFQSEATISIAVEHLAVKEQIVFDGVYSRVQSLKRNDEYFNYNQIYADFELLESNDYDEINFDAGSKKIEQRAVIISPISLTNEDLKCKNDQELLYQVDHEMAEEGFDAQINQQLTLKGLPIESQQFVPLVFLVPHMRQQNFQYSVSFLNISNILLMLLKCSWCDTDVIRAEVSKN